MTLPNQERVSNPWAASAAAPPCTQARPISLTPYDQEPEDGIRISLAGFQHRGITAENGEGSTRGVLDQPPSSAGGGLGLKSHTAIGLQDLTQAGQKMAQDKAAAFV